MGGTTMALATRDLVMYNVEVLRENLEPAMEMLAETLLIPTIDPEEVEEMKMVMVLQVGMPCPLLPSSVPRDP